MPGLRPLLGKTHISGLGLWCRRELEAHDPRTMEKEPAVMFPGSAKGNFVHGSLLPPEGTVIYFPFQEWGPRQDVNGAAGPNPHLTEPGPGSHMSTSALATQWLLLPGGPRWEGVPCSLARG